MEYIAYSDIEHSEQNTENIERIFRKFSNLHIMFGNDKNGMSNKWLVGASVALRTKNILY